MHAGTWVDDCGVTLAEWLDQWLARLEALNRSPKTLANYRGHVRDLWKPRLGKMRLRDLRRAHIEAALLTLAEPITGERPAGNVGRRVKQRTPHTIDGYRRTIRAALSAAREKGLITLNPAEGRMEVVPAAEDLDEELDDPMLWEPHDTARFREHVAGDRLAALYELAAYAGLRRGELCGLRWADIDDDGAGLTVRQTIVEVSRSQMTPRQAACPVCGEEHVGRLFKRPKSRKGRRWVPLAGPARAALDRHRKIQQEERDYLGDGYRDHDLVFADYAGLPLRPGNVTAAFKAHVIACGLPVIRLHDIRHSACALLLAGGVPIEVVQMILGHSSPEVTRRVYAYLLRRATGEQVDKATELLTQHRRQRGGEQDQGEAASGAGRLVPA